MNQSNTHLNAPRYHGHVMCSECNWYKNNAHALLSRILSIVNSDWLQDAGSVHGVYE